MSIMASAARTQLVVRGNAGDQLPARVPPTPFITRRRQLLASGISAAGLCLCCPPPPALAEEEVAAAAAAAAAAPPAAPAAAAAAAPVTVAAPAPPPSWGYSCLSGPEKWEGVCATGVSQSPIAIAYDTRFPPAPDSALQMVNPRFPKFLKDGATVKNTGHGTMQVGAGPGRGGRAGWRGSAAAN